jgi:hypothetical protein
MRFLKTVVLPDDEDTLRRICSVLQPGQHVRLQHTFSDAPRLHCCGRYAGITKAGTVVIDYTRKYIRQNRIFAKQ